MINTLHLTLDQKAMFQQLQLTRNKLDENEIQQLIFILNRYLNYPSDRLAKIHRDLCHLGEYDQSQKKKQIKNDFMVMRSNVLICECCHSFQQNSLSLTTDISTISTLSSSIQLYFLDIKYTVVWCFISFLVFGIFRILTNILSQQYYKENNFDQHIFMLISLGSKLKLEQSILGNKQCMWETSIKIFLVFVWIVFFIFKYKKQKSISIQKQLRNITVTDFSVLIKNFPIQYTKQTFQQQLDNYVNKINYMFKGKSIQIGDKYDMKLRIMDFNQVYPYYQVMNTLSYRKLSQSKQLVKQRKQQLKQWIFYYKHNKQFPVSKQERQILYDNINKKQLQIIQQSEQLKNNIFINANQDSVSNKTRTVIITLHHNYAKQNILNLNQIPWYTKLWKCNQSFSNRLNIPKIVIQQAPDPEDIIWQNFGIPLKTSICSKMLTYFQIFIILVLSCFVLYVLSLLQIYYLNTWQFSIIIPIFITIFDYILFQTIHYFSNYEKNWTHTMFEISVCNKSILSQIINSIFINIFVNLLTKNNFQKGGIAEDVFFLSITNAILPPIYRTLAFKDIYRWIKRKWYSLPKNKIELNSQKQYNQIWQKAEYKVIFGYIYIIKTTIFTAFFLSLVPIISLISCIGIIMMYYAEKYHLFKRCSRPKVRFSSLINDEINHLMKLSIISFAIGNLFFNYQIDKLNYQFKQNISNICILSCGLIFYFIPIAKILLYFQQIPQQIGLIYENQKILLPQQYQRVNPLTKKQGIRKFGQYILDLKSKYNKNNKNFIQMISYVVDEHPSNPIQVIYKIKSSIIANFQNTKIKNPILYRVLEQQPQTRTVNIQQEYGSNKESSNVNISLMQNANAEISLLQTIKLSQMEDSLSLNNSLLNEIIIKPKQIQQSNKNTNILLDLIHSILQLSDNDQFKQTIYWSSPSVYERNQQINKINQSYKPVTLSLIDKLNKN